MDYLVYFRMSLASENISASVSTPGPEPLSLILEKLTRLSEGLDNISARVTAIESTPLKSSSDPDVGFNIAPTVYLDRNPKVASETLQNRRQSTFIDRASSEVAASHSLQRVTYVDSKPDSSHIQLTELTVRAAVKFFRAAKEYSNMSQLALPLQNMVSPNVRSRLINEASVRRISPIQFYRLDEVEFTSLVRQCVAPEDSTLFLYELRDNCSLYWNKGDVTTLNMTEFLDQIRNYLTRFTYYVEFMSTDNYANTPPVSTREGGLIAQFLSKFPNDWGKNTVRDMPNIKSYESFAQFASDFSRILDASSKVHKSSVDDIRKTGSLTKTATPRILPRDQQTKSSMPTRRLAFAEELDLEDQEFELDEAIEELSAFPQRPFAKHPTPTSTSTSTISTKPAAATFTSPLPNGCFAKAIFGQCTKARCDRPHDEESCIAYYKALEAVMAKSKYNRSQLRMFSDEEPSEVLLALDNSLQTLRSCRPMRCIGSCKPDGSHFESIACRTLFDTGASSDNFLSSAFVEKHFALFQGNIVQDLTLTVLGDSKTTVMSQGKVRMHVEFISDDGSIISAVNDFVIIEHSANDVIVGLPTICKSYSNFFLELFRNAMEHFDKSLNSLVQPWTSIDETAPEDDDLPLPSSFPTALSFMEKTPEEAFEEFKSLIAEHVDPAFSKETDVVNMLLTWGYKAFVPQSWDGINGIEPVELVWREDKPTFRKPPARPINPRLFSHAEKEFRRLTGYFYIPSTSPVASPLVIAGKATPPYIRFCGDYVYVNGYIVRGHFPIPNVKNSLGKIANFKVFIDLDWVNSFHQIKLGPVTRGMLSVQTPWGQVEPLFLPEGVSPASGILQEIVVALFEDFSDWTIAIFDNLLVLADNYQDAYEKLCKILNRCIERNVYLKFSKSWLGVSSVTFFGYVCSPMGYTLSDKRKAALNAIPFPKSIKEMQSFLGIALFFAPFVPNYSILAAPLNEMVHKDFDWNSSTWTQDYLTVFEKFKLALNDCLLVYYPDYEAKWILQTDAADAGVGSVLWMESIKDDKAVRVPIGVFSQKFSHAAFKWDTICKEAYGIFASVRHFDYLLRGKNFILETDHRNLVWIEASVVAKIVRWRIYLQEFSFLLLHIPRRENVVADYFSKTFASLSTVSAVDNGDRIIDPANAANASPESLLAAVHGGRRGHFGVQRTYQRLNDEFPGHRIPVRFISDFIQACPTCQVSRIGMIESVRPVVRHLKVPELHTSVGVDLLTVTPADIHGNTALIVIVVFYSKFVFLYPAKDYTDVTLAKALFKFFCTYGIYERLHSDPGSNLTSNTIRLLHQWFGIEHVFSLVDRHESNGVEGTNKQVLRHLRALVADERIKDKWSDDSVLPIIWYHLNSEVSSETGYRPLELHLGSRAAMFHNLPESTASPSPDSYISLLNDNLKAVRDASSKFQAELIAERTAINDERPQNVYMKGDLVLKQRTHRSEKLQQGFAGPFEVVSQSKNDVECRHLTQGSISVFHVDVLKPFFGTRDEAFRIAQLDFDQFVVTSITAYRGDPLTRTTMSFEVHYADGSVHWVTWSKDIFDTIAYEDYCRSCPQLLPLLHSAEAGKKEVARIKSTPITIILPGDTVFVDLRSWGELWYQKLSIPDPDHIRYYVRGKYLRYSNKSRTKIWMEYPDFRERAIVDGFFVHSYGAVKIQPPGSVLVDAAFIKQHPAVLQYFERI